VQSVLKAFDVLFAVAYADTPPNVATLSSTLELPRPTVHRILDTLSAAGVVTRRDPDKGFVVTPKLALASAASQNTATLADMIVPYLHRLVAISEETSSLHLRIGDLRVCAAEIEGSRGIRWARGPGWSAPIWAGAVGRMLLAGVGADELDEILQRSRPRSLASNTVVDESRLRPLICDVRTRGWSASTSETVDGAAAVAAPIITANGHTIAALSMYASADRLPQMESLAPQLRAIADEAAADWDKISTLQNTRPATRNTTTRDTTTRDTTTRDTTTV
jgi:DNA-binding IclR family transcriptional regulator